jgi:signal transduction histidine kinase
MALLVGALGGLAWKLIDQDRELAQSQRFIRGQAAADLAVATLQRRLAELQQHLGTTADGDSGQRDEAPDGTISVRFGTSRLDARPAARLLYRPDITIEAALDGRATTLARTAARFRADARFAEALDAYAALASLDDAPVGGMPAALAARLGTLLTHEMRGNRDAALSEVRAIADELAAGRRTISRETYKYLEDEARVRLADEWRPPALESLADGVTWLWDRWQRERTDMGAGWTGLSISRDPVVVIWRSSGEELHGLVGTVQFAEQVLLPELRTLGRARGVDVAFGPADERPGPDAGVWSRSPAETGLPWTVRVASVDANDEVVAGRRRVLATGLSLLTVLVVGGVWVVGRGVARELEAARLKSEFVAAVSHEFRTPLTTLCQLSELLLRDRVAGDDERQAYYGLLHAESERLRRLVEGLLSFGRFEHGRADLRLEPADFNAIVRACVADFRSICESGDHRVELIAPRSTAVVLADADALRSVVWNLLDNAVKYSPTGGRIRIEVTEGDEVVEVSVHDDGVGIPRREQAQIFEPFVRGSAARDARIRGTGIGLALAREIVRAHGGTIDVTSEPGRGSTFRVRLARAAPAGDTSGPAV